VLDEGGSGEVGKSAGREDETVGCDVAAAC